MIQNTTNKINLQELAAKRGGKCLVQKYKTVNEKVEWECSKGHIWSALIKNVLYCNSWCPLCKNSIGENICKLYFETIFNKKFIKIRPNWLINECGNRLELDGYCGELSLAFEYNGEQHYSDNHPWRKNLLIRKNWDELKLQLCKTNNVKLIIIPQLFTRLSLNKLQEYIKSQLIDLNIEVPDNYEEIKFDLSKITESTAFNEYKAIAQSKGGECLSEVYINCFTKLKWKCLYGHVWESAAYTMKVGAWCPYCSNKHKMTLDEARLIVESKNGTLISDVYVNVMEKIIVKCNVCQTIWNPSMNKIKAGRWCPTCGIKKRTGRLKKQ